MTVFSLTSMYTNILCQNIKTQI